ncbi:MAG TPA: M28 family peptidase, partial [Burkholderiaceae bacterium]
MFKPLLKTAVGLAALALAAQAHTQSAPSGADKNQFKAHLAFLADDAMEGRETGTRGYDIAANYVASQYMQLGLLPKGDKQYMQAVPFKVTRIATDVTPVFEIRGKDGVQKLTYLEEFIASGSYTQDESSVTAPLVFVGYGIEAPQFNVNDYKGIDAKGKIVVMMSGGPKNLPSEEGSHFAHNSQKLRSAAMHGAVGVITLQTPAAERRFKFSAARNFAGRPSMNWTDAKGVAGNDYPNMQNRVSVSMEAAKKLFANAPVQADALYSMLEENKPLPNMDMGVSASMSKKSRREDVKSTNVVGMIEGSDPVLKNEFVVFSAHLDHLGVRERMAPPAAANGAAPAAPAAPADTIFNGAMDNASGIATLLETARMFQNMKVKPKRSILFVALTAEEKGLLGSDFFAQNPTVPVKSMVANINLDMPLLTYDFSNVVAFGAEHSSLKQNAMNALGKLKLSLIADPFPEQGIFTRSDHYNFVKQGVPSIFLATGMGSFNKNENPKQLWDEFMGKIYHKANDDLSLPFNFDAAVRFVDVNYMIGLEVANAKERPTWNKGNFFGDTFR